MLDIQYIWYLTIALVAYSVYYFFRKGDELPALLVLFLISTGLLRYQAVVSGKSDWVVVNYDKIYFALTDEKAVEALNLMLLGTAVLLIAYTVFSSYMRSPKVKVDNESVFTQFIIKHKWKIQGGFYVFLPLNTFALSRMSGSIALGNSYFYLFGMALGGLILLLFIVFRKIPPTSIFQKITVAAIIGYAAYLSFNPSARFQFLSWGIALGIYILGSYTPWQKLKYYVAGGFGIMLFFAMAGVARTNDLSNLTWEQRIDLSLERNDKREDQNMLDGFMMVREVYPQYSNFQYGAEHLGILARPIPRQLWPGKPMGGYVNRLGLQDATRGTVGISQTLYGSFFEEGGTAGIVILALIYAWVLAKLVKLTERYQSGLRYLIKGIILASVLPLLRGGDLPGIYAFIGMSFWPVFIFIYYYNKHLKKLRFQANFRKHMEKLKERD
jgi:hypothetical protein